MLSLAPLRRRRGIDPAAVERAVRELEFPEAVFKTCPWEPRELISTGLRQWLYCCAPALAEDQMIGMPSRAVDEAWHGFILCTWRYAQFCDRAYGQFLHHHPDGAELPAGGPAEAHHDMAGRLGRTVVAWSLVAPRGEECVLWDLDTRLGLENPWGIPAQRVTAIQKDLRRRRFPGTAP